MALASRIIRQLPSPSWASSSRCTRSPRRLIHCRFRTFPAYAHDARMLGFYYAQRGEERTLAQASIELGREVAPSEIQTWLHDEGTLGTLFLGEIAAAASPMIVHSPVTVDLMKERYGFRPI